MTQSTASRTTTTGPASDSGGCRIKIPVCYYQPWELPKNSLFLPIQAGKAVSRYNLKILGDDTGDNISAKNDVFSEFTVWYWVWKNIKKLYPDLEYTGMQHYRRFFDLENPYYITSVNRRSKIPAMRNYDSLYVKKLDTADIITSKPVYIGLDLKTHYASQHREADYLILRDVVHDICPEYDDAFRAVSESSCLILYCMFISRHTLFDDYLSWLFPILFEAEKRIDISGYDAYQKRCLAFLAERLFNVYMRRHKLRASYEPVFFIQPNINYRNGIGRLCKDLIKYCLPHGVVDLLERRNET